MSETRLELKITENSAAAVKGLDNLASALKRVGDAINRGLKFDSLAGGLEKLNTALAKGVPEQSVQRLERVASILERIQTNGNVNIKISGLNGTENPVADVAKTAKADMEAMNSAVRDTQSSVQGTAGSIAQVADAANEAKDALPAMNSGVRETESTLQKVAPAASTAAKETHNFKDALKGLFTTTKGGQGTLASLVSSFVRIAKMRMLRAVIRQIAEGFKLGLSNMYEYSKLVGNSFAPAMDSARNALFKMKNSLGAALAPAIQMVIPYIIQLVHWFIELVNWVNQFLALLRGQTSWTRATDAAASSMDKVKNDTQDTVKALKEAKGLLADWDELNIIQQQPTDSPGGSKSDTDKYKPIPYETMFEEVDIFDERIKKIVNWIKENFELVKSVAKDIGLAILAWQVSRAFGGVLGFLAGLAAIGLVAKIVFDITTFLDNKYLQTGDEGYLIANVLETALGAVIAGQLMSQLVSKEHAGKAGAVAAAVTLAVSATADIVALIGNKDVSALNRKSIFLAITSAAKVGAGVSLSMFQFNGGKFLKSLRGGAAAALIWASAAVGIKAVKGYVDTGEITEENLIAGVGSALTTALGVSILAKDYVPNATWGTAAQLGAAAAIAWISAPIAVKAVKDIIDTGEITKDSILKFLESGLGIGTSVALAANALGGDGMTKWKAGGIGTSVAMFVATVPIAIKAVRDVIDDGEITQESISEYLGGTLSFATSVGLAAQSMTKTVTGWKAVGAGIAASTLIASVPIAIKAVRDVIDDGEITQESISQYLGGALSFATSVGIGVASLSKSITGWKAVGVGASAGMIAAAVPLMIKVVRDMVDDGEITLDSLKAYLEGSMLIGSAFAIGAKSLGGGMWTQTAAGLGAGTLAMAVPLMAKLIKDEVDGSEITTDSLKKYVSGLGLLGSGTVLLGNAITKFKTPWRAAELGVGAVALGIAVPMGIKLVKDIVDSGEFTEKNIYEAIITGISGLIGVGSIALGLGASLTTAALISGGVVLATAAVLWFALRGKLKMDKENVEWGDYKATEEEIRKFVQEKMVDVDVPINIETTKKNIEVNQKTVANIKLKLKSVTGTMNIIKAGLDTKETYKTLENDLFGTEGVIEQVKQDAKQKSTIIQTGLTLVPFIDDNGSVDTKKTAEALQFGIQGWTEVDTYVEGLGKKLGELVAKGYTEGLKGEEPQMLLDTIESLTRISEATADAQAGGKAASQLSFTLSDLTKESAGAALKAYNEYKKQLKQDLYESRGATIQSYLSLAAKMDAMGNEEGAKRAREIANSLLEELDKSVEEALKRQTKPGETVIEKWLKENFGNAFDNYNFDEDRDHKKWAKEWGVTVAEYVDGLIADTLGGATGLGDDLVNAIDTPIAWETLTKDLKEKIYKSLVNAFGEEETNKAFKQLGLTIPKIEVPVTFSAKPADNTTVQEEVEEAVGDTVGPDIEYELEVDEESFNVSLPVPNTTDFNDTINAVGQNVVDNVNLIRSAVEGLNGLSFSFNGSFGVTTPTMPVSMAAEGGMFTAGEMFVARESGPEMVGRMGNRSAVANNDQIVAGIAGGVASGQAEQNALLRQQNEYLRKILAKESTVRVEPSSTWGKFNRRSEEMYARNTGRG